MHPTQKKLIDLLKSNVEHPLTIRELQESLDVSSPSIIHHHIQQLEKKGYLKRNPSNPRDYQVLADSPEREIVYLNLYGLAHCGPKGSFLDGNPLERVAISSKLLSFPAREAFLVRAEGDSMRPVINRGDLVVAQKTNEIRSGDIYVCINDGEAVIKKVNQTDTRKGNILTSINPKPEYAPFLSAKDFKVVGAVKGIIRRSI